jgi:hypothetical protein
VRQAAALFAVLIAATALATCRPNVQPPPPPSRSDQTDHFVTTTTPDTTTTTTSTTTTTAATTTTTTARPTYTLPPPPSTLRQRTLDTLTQLGATPEQLTIWDCIGLAESNWTNATSATGDHGVLQINQIHLAHLARIGLDPYIPEDAATYAYGLWQARGFQPWTTAKACT